MFRNLAQFEHAGYCLRILIRCCGYYTQPDDLEDTDSLQMLLWATLQPIWFWCTIEDLSVKALRTFWQVVLEFEIISVTKGLTHSKLLGLIQCFHCECKF